MTSTRPAVSVASERPTRPARESQTMAGDALVAALGDQIGLLTVELTKRDILLREARDQRDYLSEQLAARDAPPQAEPGSSSPSEQR